MEAFTRLPATPAEGVATFRAEPEQPYLQNHEKVYWVSPRTGQYYEINIDRSIE